MYCSVGSWNTHNNLIAHHYDWKHKNINVYEKLQHKHNRHIRKNSHISSFLHEEHLNYGLIIEKACKAPFTMQVFGDKWSD